MTIRKNKNTVFTIATPDVFKSPAADTYVIFGEAKIEDMQAMMQKEAALQMAKVGRRAWPPGRGGVPDVAASVTGAATCCPRPLGVRCGPLLRARRWPGSVGAIG